MTRPRGPEDERLRPIDTSGPVARLGLVLALASFATPGRVASAVGGPPPEGEPVVAAAPAEADLGEETDERPFEVSASFTYYVLPGEDDILSPVVQVDGGWIHLEGRYNYEDRDTGSVFAGGNFGFGDPEQDEVRFDATLMAGAVAGRTDGFAPGYRFSCGWRFLDLSSEGEYLFSIDDDEGDFFYSWSELAASPCDWLWLGVAGQRIRPVDSDLTLDRGPFVGVAVAGIEVTAYAMNPGSDDDYYVLSMGFSF